MVVLSRSVKAAMGFPWRTKVKLFREILVEFFGKFDVEVMAFPRVFVFAIHHQNEKQGIKVTNGDGVLPFSVTIPLLNHASSSLKSCPKLRGVSCFRFLRTMIKPYRFACIKDFVLSKAIVSSPVYTLQEIGKPTFPIIFWSFRVCSMLVKKRRDSANECGPPRDERTPPMRTSALGWKVIINSLFYPKPQESAWLNGSCAPQMVIRREGHQAMILNRPTYGEVIQVLKLIAG
jgi:hypothetical protein